MRFDTVPFFVLMALVLVCYYSLGRRLKAQNLVLLAASYTFYGWWDWRFLSLIVFSSAFDYALGLAIARPNDPRIRKTLLIFAIGVNLSILGVFKYFDFFSQSLEQLLGVFGFKSNAVILDLILPVGLSFYTFQSIAYVVDVFKRTIPAERDPLCYFTFIVFFPQLVAGPIERAGHLLEQIRNPRRLRTRDIREAVWLIAWGYFMKTVVADGVAPYVDYAFRADQSNGVITILGTLAFALQIYGDFNGYSLIAKGSALLLGIRLVWNFDLPYFSTTIRDFWRRWHISLSTWLRDYLYVPLGGNRLGEIRAHQAVFVTMGLGGLWHGASWTFVLWGLWHGLALIMHRLWTKQGIRLAAPVAWAMTMTVVLIGWFLFRCRSQEMAWAMAGSLSQLDWTAGAGRMAIGLLVTWLPVALIEIWQFRKRDLLVACRLGEWSFAGLVGALAFCFTIMFQRQDHEFIYFQF